MSNITEPKSLVYGILSQLEGVEVYQRRPKVIAEFPCITFHVINNTPDLLLDKEIGRDNFEIAIDIWGETSIETSNLLIEVEEKLRENDFRMVFSSDLEDPDGFSHITTRFIY